MNYQEFLVESNKYESFVYRCFWAYTEGWRGYPSIESIDFSIKGADLNYTVYDDRESLFIPLKFIEANDLDGVVAYWKAEQEKERNEQKERQEAEQRARDLAEFKRLQAKFSGNTGNERIKNVSH